MMKCTKHPEKDSHYFDYSRNLYFCDDCVFDWYTNRRGDHHCPERHNCSRITAEVPEYNITISNVEYARENSHKYDLVIGVADTYEECDNHWFPLNEVAPWTYAPFFWFKRIVDEGVKRGKSILVHCLAGAHRSKMLVFCWLLSKGWSKEEVEKRLQIPNQYQYDIERGYIPKDLLTLLDLMEKNPKWSLCGCLRDMGKNELITNGGGK